MNERDIKLHAGHKAVSITREGVHLENGEAIQTSHVIAAIGASSPVWFRDTGLALDHEGFIKVDNHLRSVSHPEIFAAGDNASMVSQPRPRSGVHAVRAGPPLAENLRRTLLGQTLVPHIPQKRALYLMSTGDPHAVASWGNFSWEGHWVWRWKDRIDRDFVARYR